MTMTLSRTVGDVTFTCDGESTSELFTQFAAGEEIFLDPSNYDCPFFEVDKYSFGIRPMGDTKHIAYELTAAGWKDKNRVFARKSFGVRDDGSNNLFPHRKWPKGHSQADEYIPNNGWKMYDKDAKEDVSPRS